MLFQIYEEVALFLELHTLRKCGMREVEKNDGDRNPLENIGLRSNLGLGKFSDINIVWDVIKRACVHLQFLR